MRFIQAKWVWHKNSINNGIINFLTVFIIDMNRMRWLLAEMFMGQNKLSITGKSEIKGTSQKSVMLSPHYFLYAMVWNSEKLCRSRFSRGMHRFLIHCCSNLGVLWPVISSVLDEWKETVKAEIKPVLHDESFQKVKKQFFGDHFIHNHKGIEFSNTINSLKILKLKNGKYISLS